MPADATLTWKDAPHKLELYYRDGQTQAILTVDKVNGTQTLSANYDRNVVTETLATWQTKQQKDWIQVHEVDSRKSGGAYFAMRVIEIVSGCWLWTVNHINDAPHDAFTFVKGVTADDLRRKSS